MDKLNSTILNNPGFPTPELPMRGFTGIPSAISNIMREEMPPFIDFQVDTDKYFDSIFLLKETSPGTLRREFLVDIFEKGITEDTMNKCAGYFAALHNFTPKTSEDLNRLYASALSELHMEVYFTCILNKLLKDEVFSDFWSQPKFRARFLAYLFTVVYMNDGGKDGDWIFWNGIMDSFDYENALTQGTNWLVPMTGSLYQDLQANHFARKVKGYSKSDAEELYRNICGALAHQYGEYIFSNRRKPYAHVAFPVNLFAGGEIIRQFCEQFTASEKEGPMSVTMNATGRDIDRYDRDRYDLPFRMDIQLHPERFEGVVRINKAGNIIYEQTINPQNATSEAERLIRDEVETDGIHYTGFLNYAPLPASYAESAGNLQLYYLIQMERRQFAEEKARVEKRQKDKKADTRSQKKAEALTAQIEELKEKLTKTRDECDAELKTLRDKDLKIKAQAERIKSLEASLKSQERAVNAAKADAEKCRKDKEELEKEISALQHIAATETDAQNVEQEIADIEAQAMALLSKHRVVICGGHDSWAKEIRTLHPNVKVFAHEDTSTYSAAKTAIAGADMLFFQPNAISHAAYWTLKAVAENSGKPIRYFEWAGHRPCELQLMKEVIDQFGK